MGVKWLRVAPWLGLLVVELTVALRSGPASIAGYVAACFTLGGFGALIYVRRRAASITAVLSREVEAGRLIWASQVRNGDFGGTLRLYPDLEFRYLPDDWSSKHRSQPRTWAAGTRLTFTDTHRDISGGRMQWVVLTPPHGTPTGFDTYGAVGTLPPACVV